MGKMSRDKGKVGERELAALLREYGFEARRGRQYSGGDDSPDVVTDAEDIHFEVKRVEALKLWQALAQAKEDAGRGKTPVVAHRPNKKPWIAILEMEDFLLLLQQIKTLKEKQNA